jgi:magnesium transporter
MINEIIDDMYHKKEYAKLRDYLREMEPADVAELLTNAELEEDELIIMFRILPKELAADVFVEMEPDMQETLIKSFSDKELEEVMDQLYLDDTVDIIEEMPANVVRRILRHTDPELRRSINTVLHYPKDSAGSIMTIEYVDIRKDMTVLDAFTRIRRVGIDKETIYTCYVIEPDRRLIGMVSVKTLLLSNYEDKIEDIMETNVIYTTTLEDQEEVADLFTKYDFIALPVVDS